MHKPAASGNGYLEFERPLARIEQELGRIETQQAHSKRDLSVEIKNLRTSLKNMTRQTYSRLRVLRSSMPIRGRPSHQR